MQNSYVYSPYQLKQKGIIMKYTLYGFKVSAFDAGYYAGFNGGLCESPSSKDYMKGYSLGQKNFN